MHSNSNCRICGLDQGFEPWGEDEKTPSFDICRCCGVTFGYEDCNKEAIQFYRKNWLDKGAHWFNPKEKPQDWSLEEQKKNIQEEYK